MLTLASELEAILASADAVQFGAVAAIVDRFTDRFGNSEKGSVTLSVYPSAVAAGIELFEESIEVQDPTDGHYFDKAEWFDLCARASSDPVANAVVACARSVIVPSRSAVRLVRHAASTGDRHCPKRARFAILIRLGRRIPTGRPTTCTAGFLLGPKPLQLLRPGAAAQCIRPRLSEGTAAGSGSCVWSMCSVLPIDR